MITRRLDEALAENRRGTMIKRTLTGEQAARYLLARGFPTRKDAEEALADLMRLDYGHLQNEAGAFLTWQRHWFVARYANRRDALEAEAVDNETCPEPRCEAVKGEACMSLSYRSPWHRSTSGPPYLKHPHPARIARARKRLRHDTIVERT